MLDCNPVSLDAPLLSGDDPPAFEILNRAGRSRVVLTCDHASRRIPASLGDLGVCEPDLRRHVAWDIGCAELCRRLSEALDAPAILGGYSRLVIDLNRRLSDPTSIPEVSDNVHVPGNRGLGRLHAGRRVEELFVPYHNAVAALLAEVRVSKGSPLLVAMHSFTPTFANFARPWHVGVLSNLDRRVADVLVARLKRRPDLLVGDNQPYDARLLVGYGMYVHGEGNGYPHVMIEVRQDLIECARGAERWAEILAGELAAVLEMDSLLHVEKRAQ